MLVLSCRELESLFISDDIRVTVLRCQDGHARIGIEAPQEINIVREEILFKAGAEEQRAKKAGR
jgi:carbon storage regulator